MRTNIPQRPKHFGRSQKAHGYAFTPTRSHSQPPKAKRCTSGGKVRFRSRNDAKEALTRAAYSRAYTGASSRRREIRTYLCPVCNGWHLSSEDRSQSNKKAGDAITESRSVATDDSTRGARAALRC